MAVMIEPRNDDDRDPIAAEVAGLGNRVSMLEVKLDGLAARVDERFEQVDKRFEQVDKRFEQVDAQLREQRQETRQLRQEMRAGFDRIENRFVNMQWRLLASATAITAALIAAPHL
jgi:chromosome segregation ATPase